MKAEQLYQSVLALLQNIVKKKPEAYITIGNGQLVPLKDLIPKIKRLCDWVYPDLSTDDIVLVTRCKNCRHYRRYKKKRDELKPQISWRCDKDKERKDPGFYCKMGEPK